MESERLEALNEQAAELESRMRSMMNKTSDDFGIILREYQDVMSMIKTETDRLNSISKTRQDDEKIELERDKLETNAQIDRLRASVEEEKVKQQRRSTRLQVIGGAVTGIITIGVGCIGNLLMMSKAVDLNDGGKLFTKFQEKFIFPLRFK